jgi:hypothetical protein
MLAFRSGRGNTASRRQQEAAGRRGRAQAAAHRREEQRWHRCGRCCRRCCRRGREQEEEACACQGRRRGLERGRRRRWVGVAERTYIRAHTQETHARCPAAAPPPQLLMAMTLRRWPMWTLRWPQARRSPRATRQRRQPRPRRRRSAETQASGEEHACCLAAAARTSTHQHLPTSPAAHALATPDAHRACDGLPPAPPAVAFAARSSTHPHLPTSPRLPQRTHWRNPTRIVRATVCRLQPLMLLLPLHTSAPICAPAALPSRLKPVPTPGFPAPGLRSRHAAGAKAAGTLPK